MVSRLQARRVVPTVLAQLSKQISAGLPQWSLAVAKTKTIEDMVANCLDGFLAFSASSVYISKMVHDGFLHKWSKGTSITKLLTLRIIVIMQIRVVVYEICFGNVLYSKDG